MKINATVVLGSAFGVTLILAVIVIDIAHAAGHLDLMHAIQAVYDPLSVLTFVFLCAGLAVQPAARGAKHRSRRQHTISFTEQLEPLWLRATHARPGLK